MTSQKHSILINLDLEPADFDAICAFLVAERVVPADAFTLGRMEDLSAQCRSQQVEIVALFARQETPTPESQGRAIAMIGRSEKELERYQLLQDVSRIKLVDCGAKPCAPISSYFVIASYLEAYAERVSTNAEGAILALNYTETLDQGDMTVHDTKDQAFFDLMMVHTRETLAMLNSNLGQGELPKVP